MNDTSAMPNPIGSFDINTATGREFRQLMADFAAWCGQQGAPPKLELKDGWTVFTPDLALNFLRRTVLTKNNRRVSFSAVTYYGQQMQQGDWPETGQPIILDKDGNGQDGQHRCWASVLTGQPFPTYVVASVPPRENLFAYLDNSKARSASDALETAGMDGQSRLITSVVRLARHFDAGVMTPNSKGKIAKGSPMDVLRYVRAHPGMREAIALMLSEYAPTTELFLREDVAAFVGWKILSQFGEEVLDEFLTGLLHADTTGPNMAGSPLVALRKKLQAYAENDARAGTLDERGRKKKATPTVQILAHVIKAFNAWHQHQPMRTVSVRVDETFPNFSDRPAAEEAAA